jgi:hypothetical protein
VTYVLGWLNRPFLVMYGVLATTTLVGACMVCAQWPQLRSIDVDPLIAGLVIASPIARVFSASAAKSAGDPKSQ